MFIGRAVHLFWIAAVNYLLSEACARSVSNPAVAKAGVALTWVFACSMVLHNEVHNGYHKVPLERTPLIGSLLVWANHLQERNPWHHRFPLVMLRMISFNMDRYWAAPTQSSSATLPTTRTGVAGAGAGAGVGSDDTSTVVKRGTTPATPTESTMRETSHPVWCYSPLWYFAYLFYPPLYIAGPIISCNSFLACVRKRNAVVYTYWELAKYSTTLRAY